MVAFSCALSEGNAMSESQRRLNLPTMFQQGSAKVPNTVPAWFEAGSVGFHPASFRVCHVMFQQGSHTVVKQLRQDFNQVSNTVAAGCRVTAGCQKDLGMVPTRFQHRTAALRRSIGKVLAWFKNSPTGFFPVFFCKKLNVLHAVALQAGLIADCQYTEIILPQRNSEHNTLKFNREQHRVLVKTSLTLH